MLATLFASMRAKITPLWTKMRLMLNPTYWSTRSGTTLRGFFSKLFTIKPRDKKDYYPIFNWLVSKRLAFAIVITCGLVAAWYIFVMSPISLSGLAAGDGIPTYRYSALPLKFYSGVVKILAKDGHIAYIGNVKGGFAAGDGSLYDPNDALIYSGQFDKSMYEGVGKQYYADGTVRHSGEFSKNLYHGQGEHFRPSGTLEHKGGYVNGLRSGYGELFNPYGTKIFSGLFSADLLVYSEFVGKTTPQASEMYTGESAVYSYGEQFCVEMREIGAVYSARSGANTLDEEWMVERVYVMDSSIVLGGKSMSALSVLRQSLGTPDYEGFTYAGLADAVAINLLNQSELGTVSMSVTQTLDNVYTVSQYDENAQIYICVFKLNGLVYTFYSAGSGQNSFLMYSIE